MTYTVLSNKIEVLDPDAEGYIAVQVREHRQCTEEDGVHMVGELYYHRIVYMPDHDATNDHATVRAICESIHDAEWKAKYQAKLDAEAAKVEAERVEQERIAAEAEATRLAEEEAARIAQEEAEAQRVADEQARIDAAVAAAIAAQDD